MSLAFYFFTAVVRQSGDKLEPEIFFYPRDKGHGIFIHCTYFSKEEENVGKGHLSSATSYFVVCECVWVYFLIL